MRRWSVEAVCFAVVLVVGAIAQADEDAIDDVDTDMDSAIAESVAAQTEAVDAKKRDAEERENLEKAKEEASNSVAKAKSKEILAKSEINEIEKKINESKKEQEKYKRQKADADKKIISADQRIAAKKLELAQVRVERNAGRDEKDARLLVLSQKVNEQREIEKQIAADRDETQNLVREISQLKAKLLQLEQNNKKLREKGLKVAAYKDKLKGRRDGIKRSISSMPKKLVFKMAKADCNLSEAAKDGARAVGRLSKGKKYEILQTVDQQWMKVQAGRKRGFALNSCF